jgi:hypothetical protein
MRTQSLVYNGFKVEFSSAGLGPECGLVRAEGVFMRIAFTDDVLGLFCL